MGVPFSIKIKPGKADWLRWDHPKTEEPLDICVCKYNVDTSRGCTANFPRGHAQLGGPQNGNGNAKSVARTASAELVQIRPRNGDGPLIQAPERTKKNLACHYCYAQGHNGGDLIPLNITAETVEGLDRIVAENPRTQDRILRFGKLVEVGHPVTREQLLGLLRLSAERDIKTMLPTKALEYDPRVAALLKETGSALNYSFGADHLEPGMVDQGFTQEWRAKQLLRYQGAGVRTTATIVCDVTGSFDHNDRLGYPIYNLLALHETEKTPLRLIAIRPRGKTDAILTTGREWDVLLSTQEELFHDLDGADFVTDRPYEKRTSNELQARVAHKDFTELLKGFDGKNIGACGEIGEWVYCDDCSIPRGSHVPRKKFPAAQLAAPNTAYRAAPAPIKGYRSLPVFTREAEPTPL